MVEQANIAKLATEALKPTSNLIEAWINPLVDRVKVGAKKRELRRRLDHPAINHLLEQYFDRLVRRISGIPTIISPQHPFALPDIYEPLTLVEDLGSFQNHQREERLIQNLNSSSLKGPNFIIDSAGMGKSTLAKHLVLDIFNNSRKIPVFLELRRIGAGETLMQRLALEFDPTGNDIDERLISLLFGEGNYVIVLDGFDEISEEARPAITGQITELVENHYERNTFIITSRPDDVPLPTLPKAKSFSIQSLNQEQAKSLILRYDAVLSTTIGQNLIKDFRKVPDQFLKRPLLIVLLYLTYAANNSIATKITAFYKDLYEALYRGHDLTKAGFVRAKSCQLDLEEFRRLVAGFSFIALAEGTINFNSEAQALTIIEKAQQLTSVHPKSTASFLRDLLQSVPLLVKDGNEFRFVHKSIAEYFAAEFLSAHTDSKQIIKAIRESQMIRAFQSVFDFLAEINPVLFRREVVAPLARRVVEDAPKIKSALIHTLVLMGIESLRGDLNAGEPLRGGVTYALNAQGDRWHLVARFPGSLRNKARVLVVHLEGSNSIPESVWHYIAKNDPWPLDALTSTELDFSGLEWIFESQDTIPVTDERIIEAADHSVFHYVTLWLQLSLPPVWRTGVTGLVDQSACHKLLQQVEEESKGPDLIQNILSLKSTEP